MYITVHILICLVPVLCKSPCKKLKSFKEIEAAGNFLSAMDWCVSLQNSYGEYLTASMVVFGDGASAR